MIKFWHVCKVATQLYHLFYNKIIKSNATYGDTIFCQYSAVEKTYETKFECTLFSRSDFTCIVYI